MRVAFQGGKQAGCIGLLTLKALGHDFYVSWADYMVNQLAISLHIPRDAEDVMPAGMPWDLLVSVHGKNIVSATVLDNFKYGGINLHPCLFKYPGADPIGRLLRDCALMSNTDPVTVSVGAHIMTDKVDDGPLIVERFDYLGTYQQSSQDEVYNFLYPLYAKVLIEAIAKRCTPSP